MHAFESGSGNLLNLTAQQFVLLIYLGQSLPACVLYRHVIITCSMQLMPFVICMLSAVILRAMFSTRQCKGLAARLCTETHTSKIRVHIPPTARSHGLKHADWFYILNYTLLDLLLSVLTEKYCRTRHILRHTS